MKYLENGYLDFDWIMQDQNPFKFLVGGRGAGKTFGALKWVLGQKQKFFFMRRTQIQADMVRTEENSPFKPLQESGLFMKTISKNMTGVYYGDENAPIGYITALSTIANIRGFDASEVKYIIFDEFIGEEHERALKNEGRAFLNAYETINRNRELYGEEPVKLLALANSNMLANPVFIELNLVSAVEKIKNAGRDIYKNMDRGVSIYLIEKSPILKAKEKTALYKLAGDSEFTKMALHNEFTAEEMDHINPQDLRQYKLICSVGELAIYKHKSFKTFYICGHVSGTTNKTYTSGQMDLKRFDRDFYYLWLAYLNGKILFESYIHKVIFERYFS